MAVHSTGWCLDGLSPYIESLLEWTVEFRFGLGVCEAISNKTDLVFVGDVDGRPWLRDPKPQIVHVALLRAESI
jgi:hypothetical protein